MGNYVKLNESADEIDVFDVDWDTPILESNNQTTLYKEDIKAALDRTGKCTINIVVSEQDADQWEDNYFKLINTGTIDAGEAYDHTVYEIAQSGQDKYSVYHYLVGENDNWIWTFTNIKLVDPLGIDLRDHKDFTFDELCNYLNKKLDTGIVYGTEYKFCSAGTLTKSAE